MTTTTTPDAVITQAVDTLREQLEARGLEPTAAATLAEQARGCLAVSGDGARLQVSAPSGAGIAGPAPLHALAQILATGATTVTVSDEEIAAARANLQSSGLYSF